MAFRGTVSLGDWKANMAPFLDDYNTPAWLENNGPKGGKPIQVHAGYKGECILAANPRSSLEGLHTSLGLTLCLVLVVLCYLE